jgi:hypothetical protein
MASPAHKIRVANLHVTIWRNSGDNGPWYSLEPARSYKKGDETWEEVTSLSGDEPLVMAELLRQAWAWVSRQRQADYDARKVREKAASGDE